MDQEVLITVDTPVTVTPESGRKYTSYLITIQTRNIAFTLYNSKVRRRFSEFVWLRSWLSKYYKETRVPDLPPKKYFGQQFQQSVIEERCFGLKKFLQEVVTITQYLSDSSVHLFLQTQLNVDDIITTVEGKAGKSVLETIMEAGKLLSPLESSVDSGLGSAAGSSGERHPTHLDLSKCMPSLPHHMIFSPTRPDSPILSFIPGSSSNSPGQSHHTSSTSQTATDFNDSGNVSNVSTEESGSDPNVPCSSMFAEESGNKAEEMQTRKVTSSTEVVVVSSQVTA